MAKSLAYNVSWMQAVAGVLSQCDRNTPPSVAYRMLTPSPKLGHLPQDPVHNTVEQEVGQNTALLNGSVHQTSQKYLLLSFPGIGLQ